MAYKTLSVAAGEVSSPDIELSINARVVVGFMMDSEMDRTVLADIAVAIAEVDEATGRAGTDVGMTPNSAATDDAVGNAAEGWE